jgi:hypothetical protein
MSQVSTKQIETHGPGKNDFRLSLGEAFNAHAVFFACQSAIRISDIFYEVNYVSNREK